ncbi:MAG: GntP family permease [Planctomycetes bacterium]|nr:GntP family permease [Planctomycetota bacterium]
MLGFAGVLVLLLFLIAKWKWHVFLAMLVPILIFGIIPGIQKGNFIAAFESGFGKTLGKIGVVIVLGSIIAEALKHTGAIQVITRSMVKAVGSTRMPLALTLTGFVLGIAIFSDVAYVILNPLVHASAHAMNVSIGVTSIGLVGAPHWGEPFVSLPVYSAPWPVHLAVTAIFLGAATWLNWRSAAEKEANPSPN